MMVMWVKVILIVVGALGTVLKGWGKKLEELEIRGRIETIQITELLRSARIQGLDDLEIRRKKTTASPSLRYTLVVLFIWF